MPLELPRIEVDLAEIPGHIPFRLVIEVLRGRHAVEPARGHGTGAQRIAASTTRSALRTAAFRNPDGTVVAFLLNQSDEAETVHCMLGDRQVALPSPPRTLQTLRCQA